PGQAVLALPFFALGRLGGRVLPATWIEHLAAEDSNLGPGGFELFAVLLLYPPLASGLLVALFFLVERRLGASRRSALASAVLLGATTYVAAMSVFFLRHTTEALLVLGALHAAHAWRWEGGAPRLALASLLASATLLVRIPAAVALPALAGYFAWCLDVR